MKILGIGLIGLALFFLQRYWYRNWWDRSLKVDVTFSKPGMKEGAEGEILEIIENRKNLPLSMLKVKFQTTRNLEFEDDPGSKTTDQYYRNDIFQVGGGEKITRRLRFRAQKRGYYRIRGIDLVGTDLFLSEEMVKSMSTDCYLYVYPKTFESREFQLSLQQLNGEVLAKRHLLEDPFEYAGIREYQPRDDIRSVNWKATARTGQLKVNQKNYTALQAIRIFLNVEDSGILKKEEAVEASMQITMGVAEFFLAQGIHVAVYSNGKDVITQEALNIQGGAGAGQGELIGKGLARIDTMAETLPFEKLFRHSILEEAKGTVTIFVSPNAYEDYLELLKEVQAAGIFYIWYCPVAGRGTPEMPEDIREHVRFLHINERG